MADQKPAQFAPSNDYDALILGAGIAGLSAADRLSRAGLRVAVLEQSDRCGGAHKSATIGPYTFDYGSIFYEENAAIFGLADDLKPICPRVLRRQRRIAPSGELLHYPIEPRDMLRASWSRLALSVADMLVSRVLVRPDGTLAAILKKRLGRRFFDDTGLRNYVSRFHHTSPRQIDERFFYQRMAFLDRFTRTGWMIGAAWRSLTSKKAINAKTRRPLRIRPVAGFAQVFDPIRQRLEAAGVHFWFGQNVTHIERGAHGYTVDTDSGCFKAASVVSTIPLDTLHRSLFGEPSGLQAIDMTTLFVSAASLDQAAGNVLFNFHAMGDWKRATIYSRLYPDADTTREFMAVEVTIPVGGTHDPQAAFADFASHLEQLDCATDLRLEGSAFLASSYPLYGLDTDDLLSAALQRVAAEGIITVGRQGRFEYLPTSSGVIRRVGEELDTDKVASAQSVQAH